MSALSTGFSGCGTSARLVQYREDAMLDVLEQQQRLTKNQWKIISAAVLGDMLDFFDYGLIAFALAFIVGQWKLTYGQ
jgi:putative MFS transporter